MSRLVVLLALLGTLSACQALQPGSDTSCRAVLVENQGYDDLRVYIQGRRVGVVRGYRQEELKLCGALDMSTGRLNVELRPLAGRAYGIRWSGGGLVTQDQGIYVKVGHMPAFSFARALPYGG